MADPTTLQKLDEATELMTAQSVKILPNDIFGEAGPEMAGSHALFFLGLRNIYVVRGPLHPVASSLAS